MPSIDCSFFTARFRSPFGTFGGKWGSTPSQKLGAPVFLIIMIFSVQPTQPPEPTPKSGTLVIKETSCLVWLGGVGRVDLVENV